MALHVPSPKPPVTREDVVHKEILERNQLEWEALNDVAVLIDFQKTVAQRLAQQAQLSKPDTQADEIGRMKVHLAKLTAEESVGLWGRLAKRVADFFYCYFCCCFSGKDTKD